MRSSPDRTLRKSYDRRENAPNRREIAVRQSFNEAMQAALSVDGAELIAEYDPTDLPIGRHRHYDGPIAMPFAYWAYKQPWRKRVELRCRHDYSRTPPRLFGAERGIKRNPEDVTGLRDGHGFPTA